MRLGKSKKKEEKVEVKEEVVVEEKKEYSIREMQTEINDAIYGLVLKYHRSATKRSLIKEAVTTSQVQQRFREAVMLAGSKITSERIEAEKIANAKWWKEVEELKAKRRAEDKKKKDAEKRIRAKETLAKIMEAKEILGIKNL